ncbi:MAG: OmpA family protein [Alphaproteobacteria bacterium]|nr:OmpA family protein [Alphaproteobacteria bacterium]
MQKFLSAIFITCLMVAGCVAYKSPERSTWSNYLRGASFTDMTESARTAKKPIFQGSGGKTVSETIEQSAEMEYGDHTQNETAMYIGYMSELETALYDTLRRPGLSVQRAGTDVLVILVRDAIMELNAPEISADGDDNLSMIAKILRKYNATFIEIAGYTDSMRDANAARAFSLDMAERVAVYLTQHGIKTSRMFIVGRGAARPIAAQDEWGRLANRRVEIRISPVR